MLGGNINTDYSFPHDHKDESRTKKRFQGRADLSRFSRKFEEVVISVIWTDASMQLTVPALSYKRLLKSNYQEEEKN